MKIIYVIFAACQGKLIDFDFPDPIEGTFLNLNNVPTLAGTISREI